jgi:hypothetical protein
MNALDRQQGTVAIIILAAALSASCSDAVAPIPSVQAPAATASDNASQSSVVGTVPSGPTKEAPATTSAAKSDISKAQQSNSMPMPRQANDDSSQAPNATQKANTTMP